MKELAMIAMIAIVAAVVAAFATFGPVLSDWLLLSFAPTNLSMDYGQ